MRTIVSDLIAARLNRQKELEAENRALEAECLALTNRVKRLEKERTALRKLIRDAARDVEQRALPPTHWLARAYAALEPRKRGKAAARQWK